MCLQHDVVQRFATTAGLVVLGSGAVLCVVASRLMLWIGRLPTEKRILA
jgi:tight adherence protein B